MTDRAESLERLMHAHEAAPFLRWSVKDAHFALLAIRNCDATAEEKLTELRHLETAIAACKDDVREEARQDAVADKVKGTQEAE